MQVPPGDSIMTPRLSSFVAAACIPVLAVPRDYLPFQSLIPWANITLSVRAKDLLTYHAARNQNDTMPPNPLGFLRDMPREEVTRRQQALLATRYHFLYREVAPSAAHAVAYELGAFDSQLPSNHSERVAPC